MAGGVRQAQKLAPMLRFNFVTETGNAQWSAIKVRRTGASNDTAAPFGKNSDVKFIQIYQDFNQNDALDVNDVNISEARAELASVFSSTVACSTTTPFNLVLTSTIGFPSEGRLYLAEAELITYKGSGLTGTGQPYLSVISRGDILGGLATPMLTHKAGTELRKVDLFDQKELLNTETAITLARPQTLSPLPQTFFALYEIGEQAVQLNKVGLMVQDRSAVTVNIPHDMSVKVYKGITRLLPKGTSPGVYPDDTQSSLVPIIALKLGVSGVTMAPVASGQGVSNVPMFMLRLNTDSEYLAIGQIRLMQTGTIATATTTLNLGDGDLARVTLWKDNGEGAFSPAVNTMLGYSTHSATTLFKDGIVLNVSNPNDGLPYIIVSSSPVTMYISCDVSTHTDQAGINTVGHLAGLSLASFTGLRGPGGIGLSVEQRTTDKFPMGSSELLISPGIIPITPVYSPIMLDSNGYPVFASVTIAGVVVRGTGNLPVKADGMDTLLAYWRNNPVYPNPRNPNCRAEEPLLDINNDGRPDNFDYYKTGKCTNISLNNAGAPAFDIDNDGLLDYEFNIDYIPDIIRNDGSGNPIYYMGDNVDNKSEPVFVTDLGAVTSAWASKSTELLAKWNPVGSGVTVDHYEISLGANYSEPTGIRTSWVSVGDALDGSLTGLALNPGNITKLTSRIDGNSTEFKVSSTGGFADSGLIYVGNEIMRVAKVDAITFRIVERGVQGSFSGPHTSWGETVSDRAYVLSVRGVTAAGDVYMPSVNGIPLFMYRIDVTNPTTPGAPEPQVAKGVASGQAYALKWDASSDPESNVMSYEVQEREGDQPIWKTVATIPGFKTGGALNNIHTVGDASVPGDSPRPLGKYYTYRVRSWNYANKASEWSAISEPAGTTIGTELLDKVSNFPNPVDTRKGGVEGRTAITYVLNDNAEVTITIYDLLGYLVWERRYGNGEKGGKLGPNFVLWDGKNDMGGFVSKGGYIVRVKASSPKGSKVITRKVGVIH